MIPAVIPNWAGTSPIFDLGNMVNYPYAPCIVYGVNVEVNAPAPWSISVIE